jgi:hypothetical protein
MLLIYDQVLRPHIPLNIVNIQAESLHKPRTNANHWSAFSRAVVIKIKPMCHTGKVNTLFHYYYSEKIAFTGKY